MISTNSKRNVLGRGKGYLNAAGPQFRFIVFLILVLMAYTLLLRVFQKFAEILQLPVFLPISLLTLLIFIGVVGTVYSHSFVGPMTRIRKTLEHLAQGDASITLRLRDSDDPMMKDVAEAIRAICDHTRSSYSLIQASSGELLTAIRALEDGIQRGADKTELMKQAAAAVQKWNALEQAIQSTHKP
jgi:methyl-accepting chemotaxis protein